MTAQTAVERSRTWRRTRRRIIVVVAVAALILAGTVVAGLVVGTGAMFKRHDPPFQPANSEQRTGYQVGYSSMPKWLDEGTSPDSASRSCRMAAAGVAVDEDSDTQIGMLAGCADALEASVGD